VLASAERDLVARDADLPGLATLLDPDRLATLLARLAPAVALESVVPYYLRYKPGTRCLAAYTGRVAGRSFAFHAVAHGKDAAARLEKARSRTWNRGPLREGVLTEAERGITFFAFPNDLRIPSLGWIETPERLHALLRRTFQERPELWRGTLRQLAYKPERRYVAAIEVDGAPRAVLKLYTRSGFAALRPVTLALAKARASESVVRLGRSQRRAAVGYGWVDGCPLHEVIASPDRDLRGAVHAGEALAALHARRAPGRRVDPGADLARTRASVETLKFLLPFLAPRLDEIGSVLTGWLDERAVPARITHGDFYAKQVVVTPERATLLDLDALGWGDPLRDLAVFGAHLLRDAVGGRVPFSRAEAANDALLGGYEAAAGDIDRESLDLYTAAAVLWIVPHFFRGWDPEWPTRTEALVAAIEELVRERGERRAQPRRPAVSDPEMPFLATALDPDRATPELARALERPGLRVERAELLRHKPGRRCLIAYEVREADACSSAIGKARARGLDRATYESVRALHSGGFGPAALDGICVPEPLGVLPAFRMWLQSRVAGLPGESSLASDRGPALCERVAMLVHKLQRSRVACVRVHTLADELRILHARLAELARARGDWAPRLSRVRHACECLAASLPTLPTLPAHRDLHPGQLLAESERLWVLDFDLLAAADPALDAGNFQAHVIELGLRLHGEADVFREHELALEAGFLAGAGPSLAARLRAFTTLALVRHVALSTRYPDRTHTTEALLDLCERRLDVGRASPRTQTTEAPV
jgi:aminoglycoside phosphotransferase (APT) family kinase protein